MPNKNENQQAQRGARLPLSFFTIFFILNGILGFSVLKFIESDQEDIDITLRNITELNGLYHEVLKAETGQRGFLLTDTEAYLGPYSNAVEALERKLADPGVLQLNEDQSERYRQFSALIRQKLDELADTVSAANENRAFEAIQLVFTNRGFNLMDDISNGVNELVSHENLLLLERQSRMARNRGIALYLVLAANLLGILMVLILARLARKARITEQIYVQSLQDARDTLELKVAERTETLQHYSSELKRSNRELQDFAFVASHDLQEPLRKIQAFSDRLQTGFEEQLDEQGKDYLQRMKNAASRMSQLIEDLLTFSRITSKAQPFLDVSLSEIMDQVLDNLEVAIEESQARIEIDALPEIEADASQMRQLFQNLIGNALKFRKEGVQALIEIKVRAMSADENNAHRIEWVEIEISDNGIGFDSQHAEVIFKPFQRLHRRDEYRGTGIGLAICRRIVERHGGTISAASKEGVGTRIIIRLPLQNNSFNLD